MTITERAIYLLIILGLLLLLSLEYWWFERHYNYLIAGFNIVWEHCK